MGREREQVEARRLRASGLTYQAIGDKLGVSLLTAWRWCDPEHAARQLAVSRRWKAEHREQNRARDREYARQPEQRGICASPICTSLRGQNGLRNPRGYCAECVHVIAEVRRTLVEGMWADGWLMGEIRKASGMHVPEMRQRGADLPYRYSSERVARITEGARRAMGSPM